MAISIGNRIAELRKKQGMTQSDLAKHLNVKRTTVSKWENEPSRSIPSKNMIELARLFSVSADYLLGLSAEPSIRLEIKALYQTTGLTLSALKALQYFKRHGTLAGPKTTIEENSIALSRVLSSIPFLETIAWLMQIEDDGPSVEFDMSAKYKEPYYHCDMSPSSYFNCQALHLINLIKSIRDGKDGNERYKQLDDFLVDQGIKPEPKIRRNSMKATDSIPNQD